MVPEDAGVSEKGTDAGQPSEPHRGRSRSPNPTPTVTSTQTPAIHEPEWTGDSVILTTSDIYNKLFQQLFKDADAKHLRLRGGDMILQIDATYVNPVDRFRWMLLKGVVSGSWKVTITTSAVGSQRMHKEANIPYRSHTLYVKEKDATIQSEDREKPYINKGTTLISMELQRHVWSDLVTPTPWVLKSGKTVRTGVTSRENEMSFIFLKTEKAGSRLARSLTYGQVALADVGTLAHELLGHFSLATRGAPYEHSGVSDQRWKGSEPEINLRDRHKIKKPDGSPFTGKVEDYIRNYVTAGL